ncbi:YrhA family protein [Acidisphaera sp. S103]|uniref:YrhA family protein n=1 Tax=Acidisphaera sp. S103 TaxID=1747223 RepID=UPI00131AF03B|nr:YrhA family protein [Acidisphaera sp. S103]
MTTSILPCGEPAVPELEDLLARIDTEKRIFDQIVWPPASADAFEGLGVFARDTLQTELPPGYIALLRRNDGIDFNSYAIYGANEHARPFLSGFAEANMRLSDPAAKFVFYGDTGHEFYAQERQSGTWVVLDSPSLDAIVRFPSFDTLLMHVLTLACAE